MTLEISDWSVGVSEVGCCCNGEETAVRNDGGTVFAVVRVHRQPRVAIFAYFYAFLEGVGSERTRRKIAMRFYELFHIRERSVIRAEFAGTVQVERLR